MYHHRCKHHRVIAFLLCMICISQLTTPSEAATSLDDVYQITDLSNRGLDVILKKSKGMSQPTLPEWTEQNLTPFHVYQLQVASLDEIRRMQSTFKMTPYPHIIVSPEPLTAKHLYKLSTIILSEIRRIAIHLNIWGLAKQKRSFSGENSTTIFSETMALYLKLRMLGGHQDISDKEIAGEFGKTVDDVKSILNHLDPARRYRDVFPATTQQTTGELQQACLNIRQGINTVRLLYKLPKVSVGSSPKTPTNIDLFLQNQIILGELNQLKITVGMSQPAPCVPPQTNRNTSDQLNLLEHLIKQIEPLAKRTENGGHGYVQ